MPLWPGASLEWSYFPPQLTARKERRRVNRFDYVVYGKIAPYAIALAIA